MRTREDESRRGAGAGHGLVDAVRELSERVSALLRLEVELAVSEVRGKAGKLVKGASYLLTGRVLAFLGFCFGLVDVILAATASSSWWVTFLCVTIGLFAAAALLLASGVHALKQGASPRPAQALEEARKTKEAINGR